ncbi:unnamed protein product [Orchesella dallaii]|uniref:C-type lectin domain-containing protein n=1 Tax=Orchesella dallaii TaxID=48710 RepID=A0ABP1PJA5_9HEXA
MWVLGTLFLVLYSIIMVGAFEDEDVVLNLGTIDGKSYYTDTVLRNYTASRCFCKNNGMRLATITNEIQAEFLKSQFNVTNFSGWYWVGAIDHEGHGNFTWTETGKPVQVFKTLDLAGWNNEDEVNNCLCYSSNNQQKAYYFKRACYHAHYAICERKSNSKLSNRKRKISVLKAETKNNSLGDVGEFVDIK